MLAVFAMPLTGKSRLGLFAALIVASIGMEIFFAVRTPKIPQRIVVDRHGVKMFRGDETILELPWNEIRTVKTNRFIGAFSILGESNQPLFMCSTHQLAKWGVVKKIEDAIVRGKLHYMTESAGQQNSES